MAILKKAARSHSLAWLWFAAGCLAAGVPAARAELAELGEYRIKAVFLFNFAEFVEWPPEAFDDAHAPFVIGVLGDDPFGSSLDEVVRGEQVNDRPLVVRRFRVVKDIDACHILFISRSEAAHLDKILATLHGRSLLTVGDMEGFAQHGGVIRFITENKHVRLRINLQAAKAAHLVVSSKLLRPSDIVAPGMD